MSKQRKRLLKPPKGSFFLFGPRGTGKSTWIKKTFPDSFYVDLLLPNIFRLYGAYPEKLKDVIDAQKKLKTVVIDEIQKVPELLPLVHLMIEENPDIQFILTGSSARKLKKIGVDLLAGRAVKRSMHPFMAAELGQDFNLETSLKLGMLPLVWGSKDSEEALETYTDLYIQQEVQQEGLVRHYDQFSRFLSVIAFSHGQILNTTNIARECEVKRNTVENFIEILQDLLLASQLPVFTKRAQRHLTVHPKFYLFDAGVYRVLRKHGIADTFHEINGAGLEGLVFQHLKAWIDLSGTKYKMYYWRTKAGLEVDFIIHGENKLWAIEVKNSTKISSHDVRGLLHFKEDYPECEPLLLYRGKERMMERGILCMPCEEFLVGLNPLTHS